jgi:predicted ribosomally synthesized peptide with nif11-like leader
MATQDVYKFWEKLGDDQALAKKLQTTVKAGAGWDPVVSFANANGFKFTKDDYASAVQSLPKAFGNEGYKAWKKGEKLELGDEELEKVAGGIGSYSFLKLGGTSALSFSSPLRSIIQPWGAIDQSGRFNINLA